jgi:broad specificity phosphatase PhoE
VFAHHAESAANADGVVSSDPAHRVALTPSGTTQARWRGAQLAGVEIELAVATGFVRTQQPLTLAPEDRAVPVLIERRFDEIRAGDCERAMIEDYGAWRIRHGPDEHFRR